MCEKQGLCHPCHNNHRSEFFFYFFYFIHFSTYSFKDLVQIRKLPLYQTRPSAIFPPTVHSIDTFPQSFLVEAVYLIFPPIKCSTFPLCHFNRCLVFTPGNEGAGIRQQDGIIYILSYLRSSISSFFSGKKRRGSRTARIPREARYTKESPSRSNTSHIRAQASKGRWSKNKGVIQPGRYAAGDI
jgi:hypothetical protein